MSTGILMAGTAAAAAWSLKLATRHDGDSFLPVLMSLQRLTVFFWGQNRFGNVLPFAASWVRDVGMNFQLQIFLRALGAAAVPLMGLAYLGVRKRLPAAYALALGLMLLPFSDQGNFWIWIDPEPYGPSAFFFAAALWVRSRNRGGRLLGNAAVMALAWVAFFINAALGVFVLPLWTAAALVSGKRRDWWFAGQLAAAFVLGCAPSFWFGSAYHENYNYAHMEFDFANFSRCAASVGAAASGWALLCYVVVIVCGLWVVQSCRGGAAGGEDAGEARPGWRRLPAKVDPLAWRSALALAAGAFYIALFANMGWVKLNGFAFRYFMFPLMFVPVVCAAAVVEAAAGLVRGKGWRAGEMVCTGAALAFLAGAVLLRLAPFGSVDSHVDARHRADAMAVAQVARDNGATFVAGDYYLVWPSVFYAIHLRQEAGDAEALRVYGLAPKGENLREVYADQLRAAQRVVVVGANTGLQGCYETALYNDATDWPGRVSLVKSGTLPSGGTYCVLVFERDGQGTAQATQIEARLPAQGAVMLRMMRVDSSVAQWVEDTYISVPYLGPPRVAARGPGVNLPAGKYRASFEIETATRGGGPAPAPLLQLDVVDRFGKRNLARRAVAANALEARDGGRWASVEFEVPADAPTENLDVWVWTFGTSGFDIKGMEIRRIP